MWGVLCCLQQQPVVDEGEHEALLPSSQNEVEDHDQRHWKLRQHVWLLQNNLSRAHDKCEREREQVEFLKEKLKTLTNKMAEDAGTYTKSKVSLLIHENVPTHDSEKVNIYEHWKRGCGQGKIVHIKRVNNRSLWKRHKLAEELLGKDSYEFLGFHGCPDNTASKIENCGLDPLYCQVGLYGQGSYISTSAAYARNYAPPNKEGHRCVFVVRAVFDKHKLVQGHEHLKHASDGKGGHHVAVDNLSAPTIMVTFRSEIFYPMYRIDFID